MSAKKLTHIRLVESSIVATNEGLAGFSEGDQIAIDHAGHNFADMVRPAEAIRLIETNKAVPVFEEEKEPQ